MNDGELEKRLKAIEDKLDELMAIMRAANPWLWPQELNGNQDSNRVNPTER